MNYKKGDKVRVKEGCEGCCKNYITKVESNYIVITSSGSLYVYDILNRNGKVLSSCCCFTDEHLEPFTKDFSTIDTGDVVVSKYNLEYTILGRAGELIFIQTGAKGEWQGILEDELKKSYTIKQPSTEPLELSVEEISKRLGYEVKIIKK